MIDDAKSGFTGPFQCVFQCFLFIGGKGAQHPVGQFHFRMGFCTHTDLDPGKCLGTNLCNDGLDAVVAAGRAVSADSQTAGNQGNVIKHDDDPGRGDVKIGRKLQHTATGQIHVGLGFQQKDFFAPVNDLAVKSLEFYLINPAAQRIGQQVDGAEACIVAGFFIVPAWITQTDDEP